MSLQIIATCWNEAGPYWQLKRPVEKRHEIEDMKAKWREDSAYVERFGHAPLTITETVETMEEAA